MIRPTFSILAFSFLAFSGLAGAADYNALILERLSAMPKSGEGAYAKYRKELPSSERFNDLHVTMQDLQRAISVDLKGRLKVSPGKADRLSFCSSATYLLFCDAVAELQKDGRIGFSRELSAEMADVGDYRAVIGGELDGIGIFGHWNADGPGTAVLFQRLGLGRNFSSFAEAKPGDFLKIFWNESIGKGERGHLVLYLGESESGDSIKVWSSNMENSDGSSGYGTMFVEKSRIKRALFSRLEHPENLANWLNFSEEQKKSDYLIRIRKTGSTGEEMKRVTAAD